MSSGIGAGGGSQNTLKFGDVVTLYSDNLNGWLTSGDLVVGWGLWLPKLKEKLSVPPRVRETRFQIVPKFYYSTRKAYRKEVQSRGGGDVGPSATLNHLQAALEVENEQNESEMKRLMGEDVVYGQVVQLRHVSGEFITVKKTMAKIESQCLKVMMDEHGDEGSWFRIDPAFKFRSNGQRVPHGDSVMFTSTKFDQSLHVSPKCLPFQSLYINGVYEANASTTPTYFKVIPFASNPVHEVSQPSLKAGKATVIFHSEINAYLMYDPTTPAKGPFWQVKSRKESGHRHDSKALWIIEADSAEWGGGDVYAQNGVGDVAGATSKRKGYRLEHVCSGHYLSLSLDMLDDSVTRLSMTDSFYSNNTLWYFRTKGEDEDADEGEMVRIDLQSATPIYLQHSSGMWLTQRNPLKKERRGEYSNVHDQHAGCRKSIILTDSLSLPVIDPRPMAEISRVLKLLKPVEFYVESIKAAEQPPEVLESSHPKLRELLGMEEGEYGDVHERTEQVLSELRASPPNKAGRRPELAQLLWAIAFARSLGRVRFLEQLAISMLKQNEELVTSLRLIGKWLCKTNQDGTVSPDKWCQKTLKQQGALRMLQELLAIMVRTGYVAPVMVSSNKATMMPSNPRTSMGAAAATLSMLRVANAIYSVLELACKGNRKVAPAFVEHMGIFDRHLGTQVKSAMLMRELYCNRQMLVTLGESKVERYTGMFGTQRKPAFILLLRSLVSCEGQPITANQLSVTRVLMTECKAALPKVRIMGGGLPARPLTARSGGDATARSSTADAGSGSVGGEVRILIKTGQDGREAWVDISTFRGSAGDVIATDEARQDSKMMAFTIYAECLSLFTDLCNGRNETCIKALLAQPSLSIDYLSMVKAMRSEQVPLEIRARLWDLILPLHVDRNPLSVQPNVGRTHVWSRVMARVQTGAGGGGGEGEGAGTGGTLSARQQQGQQQGSSGVGNGDGRGGVNSAGYSELVSAALDHLGSCFRAKEGPSAGGLDLLRSVCRVTLRMCELGLFGAGETAGLGRLVDVVLDNLGNKAWQASGGDNVVAIQLLMVEILDHAFGVRTDMRRRALVQAFESEFDRAEAGGSGQISSSRFWTAESVHDAASHIFQDSDVSSRLGLELDGDLLACLMPLVLSYSSLELQSRSWTLIMRQASQLSEAVAAAKDMQLLTSDAAVICFNAITDCSRRISDLTTGAANGDGACVQGLQRVLHELVQLTRRGEYDVRLVENNQRLMRWQKLHKQVLEILAIPLEVTPSTTGGPDKAANSTLRDLMNECYSFLIAFCDSSEENQAECYWELPLLITHLSVEGLKASECVSAIFKDNEGLCSKVSEKLVRKFLGVIVKHGKSSRWLKVLLSFVEVSGRTIERTQGLVLKLMQDEAEIILELDGNQGGGEGDAAETLAREGNETRYELMMRSEHSEEDSFLSYHTTCLDVLAKCAEGKKPGPKMLCQALVPYDMVMESILDLELIDRPDGDRQLHDPDSLRFVRSAWVKVLRHVYFCSSSEVTCSILSDENSRIYGPSPAQHPRDKWRNQTALMLHFTQEIEELSHRLVAEDCNGRDPPKARPPSQTTGNVRSSPLKRGAQASSFFTPNFKAAPKDADAKRLSGGNDSPLKGMGMSAIGSFFGSPDPNAVRGTPKFERANSAPSHISERPPGSDVRIHASYVLDSILPCLADYYSRQYRATLRKGNRCSEVCEQHAERVCAAVAKLVEGGKLAREQDVQACLQVLHAASKVGIQARTDVQYMLPFVLPPPTHRNDPCRLGRRLEEAWPVFFSEVATVLRVPGGTGQGDEINDTNTDNAKDGTNSAGEVGGSDGIKEVARLLSRSHDTYLSSLCHVLSHGERNPAIVPSSMCRSFLPALRGALYLAVSTPMTEEANWLAFLTNHPPDLEDADAAAVSKQYSRFLHVGALSCSLHLTSHSSEDVVLSAVRLSSQLLSACPSEAQGAAMEVLKNDNRKVLGSLRACLQRTLEQIKASKKLRKKERLRAQAQSVMTPRAGREDFVVPMQYEFSRAGSAGSERSIGRLERADSGDIVQIAQESQSADALQPRGEMACELLEMIELICRGHQKIQRALREHDVLTSLISFMEELERDLLSSLNTLDGITIFTLAKGFHVLTAAIGGPFDKNRDAITRTSILTMLNRIFGKLNYSKGDNTHNILKSHVRSAAAWLLLDLLQSPSNPVVAKRVLETIDWDGFLSALKNSTECLKEMCTLLQTTPEDLMMSTPQRVSESLSGFSKRFSDHLVKTGQTSSAFPNQPLKRASSNSNRRSSIFGPSKRWSGARSWIKSTTKVEGVDDEEEYEPAQRRDTSETAASGNIAREGFMASLALELILAQDLFSAHATALLHRQSDLRELVHAIDLSFYTFRLASVEISRRDRLERLHFVLPEMAVRLQDNETFLEQLDDKIFNDLPTDDDRTRQAELLERMVSCSRNLRCEVQVTTGANSWVVERKIWLEGVPLAACIAANVVFLLGFDEHGPVAEVCTPIRYLDMGRWGKPFFHLSPWVLLLLGLLHLASSALRVLAMIIQRFPYHAIEKDSSAVDKAHVGAADGKQGNNSNAAGDVGRRELLTVVASMAKDREVLLVSFLLVSSLLGLLWSPFCYAIPLIDLLRSPTVLLLLGSVEHNANKLGQGALVGALLVYGHAILGYAFFRSDHAEGKCNNLFGCMTTYLISGIKGDSLEGGALEDLVTPHALWMDSSMWFRIVLDMSFHIIIPLILLSIISGIIIDGFGELRDKEAEEKEYREETSVVCGMTKTIMEQVRPGAFQHHMEKEQNRHHYVFLLLALELQNRDVDTQQEAHVRDLVLKGDHSFFPTGAMCMQGHVVEDDETKGNEMQVIISLLKGMDARVRSVERELRHMQVQAKTTPATLASLPEIDQNTGLWGALSGGLPPIGMPDFKMPDLGGVPGLGDIKAPDFSNMRLPGVLGDIRAPEFRMPDLKIPAVPVVDKEECKQQ